MPIRLSKTDINQGVSRAMKVFKKADTNKTGVVYPAEINAYDGPGRAALKKVFAYARHIEGGTAGDDFVHLTTMKGALNNLAKTMKKIADTKGNKDGKIDGSEIKYLSTAGAALARFTHATKND